MEQSNVTAESGNSSVKSLIRLAAGLALGAALAGCAGLPSRQSVLAAVQQHTQCPGVAYADPVQSPDGALIYYTVYTGVVPSIHVMQTSGASDRLLVQDASEPQPSPDGKLLLFKRLDPQSLQNVNYYLLDLATGQARQLLAGASSAAWSPDSRTLVYVQSPQTIGPLGRIDVATGQVTALTDTPANSALWDAGPVWSPDGKRLAFMSNRAAGAWVYVMPGDGRGAPSQLTASRQAECKTGTRFSQAESPDAWLPDGSGLLVTSWCGSAGLTRIVRLDGAVLADLAGTQAGQVHSVEWSPAGRRFLIWAVGALGRVVVTADADGGHIRQAVLAADRPRWTADGQHILYQGSDPANYNEIFIADPDGANASQITQNPGAGRICLH